MVSFSMQFMKIMPGAALGAHGCIYVIALRFDQLAQIELHNRLVGIEDVELVLLLLGAHHLGVVAAVGDRLHHGIRNMADTAKTSSLQRQHGGRNIHTHAADHDRHQLVLAQAQAKIVDSFHVDAVR